MPELLVTSVKLTPEEHDRLGRVAERTGCPRSRVLRVALGEVCEMPTDELRERAAVLPDFAAYRSSKRRASRRTAGA
jgi:predicted transcriptional regulator